MAGKKTSWRELKALEIFDGIANGDCPQYKFADFDDINKDIFDSIDEDTSDYEIETAMNKSLLNNGYEWVEQKDYGNDLALVKKS